MPRPLTTWTEQDISFLEANFNKSFNELFLLLNSNYSIEQIQAKYRYLGLHKKLNNDLALGYHFKAVKDSTNLPDGLYYTKEIVEEIYAKPIEERITAYQAKINFYNQKDNHLVIYGPEDELFHPHKDRVFKSFCLFGDYILLNLFYSTLSIGFLANSEAEAESKAKLLLAKGWSSFSFEIRKPGSLKEFANFAVSQRAKTLLKPIGKQFELYHWV